MARRQNGTCNGCNGFKATETVIIGETLDSELCDTCINEIRSLGVQVDIFTTALAIALLRKMPVATRKATVNEFNEVFGNHPS